MYNKQRNTFYCWQVAADPSQAGQRDGIFKVEGGGLVECDNCHFICDVLDVDESGSMTGKSIHIFLNC